jgi:hypothetical protein
MGQINDFSSTTQLSDHSASIGVSAIEPVGDPLAHYLVIQLPESLRSDEGSLGWSGSSADSSTDCLAPAGTFPVRKATITTWLTGPDSLGCPVTWGKPTPAFTV